MEIFTLMVCHILEIKNQQRPTKEIVFNSKQIIKNQLIIKSKELRCFSANVIFEKEFK